MRLSCILTCLFCLTSILAISLYARRYGRVARRRAVRVPSRSLITFPPRPTIIPDGGLYPIRLEADAPSGQPPPSHSSPACTRASQWFAMAFGSNRLPALSRRGNSPATAEHSRRLSPSCSPRRPEILRSCGLLSPPSLLLQPHAPACRPPHTLPGVSGYSAGPVDDRPSLLCIPDLVTVPLPPTPENSPGAFARPYPGDSAFAKGETGSALSTSRNCLRAGEHVDAAAISLRL